MLHVTDAAWHTTRTTKSFSDWQYFFRQQHNKCLTIIQNAKLLFMSLHYRKVKETQQTFEKHLNRYQIILLHPYLRKTLKILPSSQVERVYVIHSINILFHLATFLKVLAFL